MRKLIFKKLHREIEHLDKKIHREKLGLRSQWGKLKRKLQTPEAMVVFLVSGVAVGYFLTRKKHTVLNEHHETVILETRPSALSKAFEIATVLAPFALNLVNTQLALEKKPKTRQNAH